jgi:hypothetical protein
MTFQLCEIETSLLCCNVLSQWWPRYVHRLLQHAARRAVVPALEGPEQIIS